MWGGYTALTRKLLDNCEYHLLDFIAYGGNAMISALEEQRQKHFWINEDWMEYDISQMLTEYTSAAYCSIMPNGTLSAYQRS